VPTPFTHLALAGELLDARPEGLSPALHRALAAERSAFLFGNVAPDAQTVSGQTREATHFFPVPLGDAPPAPLRLFSLYPALARPDSLPPAQAAFLAGYLAHLALDQLWVAEIFEPFFGERQAWGTFPERLYLHNALRAYWDAQDLRRLPPATALSLHTALPRKWLPFLDDASLVRWRDLVAGQLTSGAARTVEVFAERMGADPGALADLVNSPRAMRRQVFARSGLAPERLARHRTDGLARCVQWIQAYWEGAGCISSWGPT
jgi:hypothetical protein